MTTRLVTPKYALLRGTAAVLLGAWSMSAVASNGFDTHCTEATDALPAPEISIQVLTINVVEHGLISVTADMVAPAADSVSDAVVSPALADVTTKSSSDAADKQAGVDESAPTANELPGSALQLPGVSEADLPRFRRQMYRTDI